MADLGSSFISSTALDKNHGVRPPFTLIEESPWVVAPGAYLGKLFLVSTFYAEVFQPMVKTRSVYSEWISKL